MDNQGCFIILKSLLRKQMFPILVRSLQMPDPKTYKQHFESKHPKADLPDELKNV